MFNFWTFFLFPIKDTSVSNNIYVVNAFASEIYIQCFKNLFPQLNRLFFMLHSSIPMQRIETIPNDIHFVRKIKFFIREKIKQKYLCLLLIVVNFCYYCVWTKQCFKVWPIQVSRECVFMMVESKSNQPTNSKMCF